MKRIWKTSRKSVLKKNAVFLHEDALMSYAMPVSVMRRTDGDWPPGLPLCGLGRCADYRAKEVRPRRGDWRNMWSSSAVPVLMEPGFTTHRLPPEAGSFLVSPV